MGIIEADILQIEYGVFNEKMRLHQEINMHRTDLARLVCIYQVWQNAPISQEAAASI